MNKRLLSALIFSLIVVIELIFFISAATPTIYERPASGSIFGGTTTVNYEAKEAQDRMYYLVIGATILIGAIVTFSIPQNKK